MFFPFQHCVTNLFFIEFQYIFSLQFTTKQVGRNDFVKPASRNGITRFTFLVASPEKIKQQS